MLVRFLCPSGHQLIARPDMCGEKAQCPVCYQMIVVPVRAPRASGRRKKRWNEDDEPAEASYAAPAAAGRNAADNRGGAEPDFIPTDAFVPVPEPVAPTRADARGGAPSAPPGGSTSYFPPLPGGLGVAASAPASPATSGSPSGSGAAVLQATDSKTAGGWKPAPLRLAPARPDPPETDNRAEPASRPDAEKRTAPPGRPAAPSEPRVITTVVPRSPLMPPGAPAAPDSPAAPASNSPTAAGAPSPAAPTGSSSVFAPLGATSYAAPPSPARPAPSGPLTPGSASELLRSGGGAFSTISVDDAAPPAAPSTFHEPLLTTGAFHQPLAGASPLASPPGVAAPAPLPPSAFGASAPTIEAPAASPPAAPLAPAVPVDPALADTSFFRETAGVAPGETLRLVETPPAKLEFDPTSGQRAVGYGTALFLILLSLASLWPALTITLDGATPTWAKLVMAIVGVQILYSLLLAALPDWSVVWLGKVLLSGVALLYAIGWALLTYGPTEGPLVFHLEIVRNDGPAWCVGMGLASLAGALVCRKFSRTWRRDFEIQKADLERRREAVRRV